MPEVTIERSLALANVTVELRNYHFRGPLDEDVHLNPNFWFIDLSLTPRPSPALGRYEDLWRTSRLEPIGEVLLVPAGMPMRGSCLAGSQRSLSCLLDPGLFASMPAGLSDVALSETLHLESAVVKRGLMRMLQELSWPNMASPLAVDALATLVAVDASRHLTGKSEPRVKRGGMSRARLRLIEDRLHAPLQLPTVAELAELCGLSARHVARAFLQETGRSLSDYIRAWGTKRALAMLTGSDLRVKQIAAELGFSSSASFTFAFRQATGSRPTDVRRRRARRNHQQGT